VATPVEGDVRAVTGAQAVLPPQRDGGQAAQWSDATWTSENSARAARAYQRAGRAGAGAPEHGPFTAQRFAQEGAADGPMASLHQQGVATYRATRDAGTQFARGDMGIDLHA
jgi:hypothetical protein